MKGDQVHHDDDCSRKDARGAGTSYCATNDEGSGIGSSPTYYRSNFKDADGGEEDPFGVVESVDSAHDELEGASGEHVGAGIPSNVIEGVEFIGDCRYSGCDDCAVLDSDQP